MEEIREYEDQLIAVRDALKEEASDELKEVEAELLSLLAELRKNLPDTSELPDHSAKDSNVEGEQGSDKGDNQNVQSDGDHVRKFNSKVESRVRREEGHSEKHKVEPKEEPEGHAVEKQSQDVPRDKLETSSAFTNKAQTRTETAQEENCPQDAEEPRNSQNHSGHPPNVKDDYELGRAKWKTFSGRIAKRKKHK